MKKSLLIISAVILLLGGLFAAGKSTKASTTVRDDTSIIQQIDLEKLEHRTDDSKAPVVYFISDVSAKSMLKLYQALGWTATGKTGVKISTGEPPASNYLRPQLLKDTVQKVNGTIVECNTAYGGSRASNRGL